ncbi:MAG: haloacid dehalogenase type II [Bacteroidota bacterium]
MDKINTKSIFVFDAFGTLFKTSEIEEDLKSIAGSKTESLISVWRKKQLEYTWLRNQMNQYAPFDEVTKEALDYSMRLHGLDEPKIFDWLLPIYDQPSLIDGVGEVLIALQTKGIKIGILSNGTMPMLKNGVRKTGIENIIDFIFSADEIGVYKPRSEVYQMAMDNLNTSVNELLFISSNQWDVSGASNFGWECVWLNRSHTVSEKLPFGKVTEINDVNQLPGLFFNH